MEGVAQQPPPVPAEPPEDPEAWTDEQWLAWLKATDPEGASDSGGRPAWRQRPAGSMLGAAMLGLRDAIYGRPDEEVAIVAEVPGGPPDADLHELHLDPEHPERSEVVVRRSPGAPKASDS